MAKLLSGTRIYGTATVDTNLIVSGTEASISTLTGALTVAGGAGIRGDLYVGGTINGLFAGTFAGSINTATNLAGGTAGQVLYQNNPGATSFAGPGNPGEILVSNGTNGPVFVNTLTLAGTVQSVSTDTGTLIVKGGAGITGNLYVGGEIVAEKLTIQLTTVTTTLVVTDDVIQTLNTTQAFNTASGALIVAGGAGIGLDLWVGGDVYSKGVALANFNTATLVARAITAENIANGTAGQLLYQSAAGTTGFVGPGNAGEILVSNGASSPVYTSTGSIYVGRSILADSATDLSGGLAGQIVIQAATGDTSFIESGAAGQLLQSQGTTATFVNTSSLTVGFANKALNVVGGASGSIVYQSNTDETTFLPIATTSGWILRSTGTVPGWVPADGLSVNSTNNLLGGDSGSIPVQSASGTTAFITPGSAGQILQSQGTTATFVNTSSLTVGFADKALDVSGGSAGSIVMQSAANETTFIASGSAGQLLQSQGTTATFVSTGSLIVGFADKTNDVLGGTAGQLLYQSSTSTTAFTGPGTAGDILVSNGSSAPSYIGTGSIYVGRSVTADTAVDISGGATGQLVIQAGNGDTAFVESGAVGQLLQSQGTTATFVNTSSLIVGFADTTNNIKGGAAGSIVYQSNSNATTTLPIATTSGWILRSNGSIPNWIPSDGLTSGNSDNITGGNTGSIPIQVSSGVTAFIQPGAVGQILQSQGTTATFVNTSSLQVGVAVAANTVETLSRTTNADHFLTFVDSNNDSVANELVYTTSTIIVNPNTGRLGLGTTPSSLLHVNGDAIFAGITTVTNTTVASSTTTGALQVAGGAGIGLDLYVGGTIYAGGAPLSTFDTSTLVLRAINVAAGAAGSIPIQSAADATSFIAPGADGQLLQSQGTTATFVNTNTLTVGFANRANNVAGGALGSLVYQSGSDSTTTLPIATTSGWILRSSGSVPNWVPADGLSVNSTNNILGGDAGSILMQSANGVTTFITPGVSGQLLQSNGTTSSFVNTSTLTVGFANTALNIANGSAGAIVYQSAAGTTDFVALSGTQKSLLTAGASAPVYVTQVQAQSGTGSDSSAAGQSLVVTGGGLGVTGNSYFANILAAGDTVKALSTASDTGTKLSNSLYVAGGAWIDKTLIVEGQTTFKDIVVFAGTATFVNSTNTVYTDNLLNLHTPPGGIGTPWTFDDGKDIGLIFHYYKGADKTGFLGFANDSGYLEWYNDGTEVGDVFTGTTYGTFKTGSIKLVDNTEANSTTSGALTVVGGAGVGRDLWVGGNVYVKGSITATSILIDGIYQVSTGTQFPVQYFGSTLGTADTLNVSTGLTATLSSNVVTVSVNTANTLVSAAINSVNLRNGGAGAIPMQTSAGVTSFIQAGTAGQLLQSQGTTATFVNTSTLQVGIATLANEADQIKTTSITNNADYFVTFVDSNNAVATSESLYTTSSLVVNPTTGRVGIGITPISTLHVNGDARIEGSLTVTNILIGGVYPVSTASALTVQYFTNNLGAASTLNFGTGITATVATGVATIEVNTASTLVSAAITSDNIKGGATGSLVYQSGASATTTLPIATTSGWLLRSTGSIPNWIPPSGVSAGVAAQIETTARTNNTDHFLTFVDSNNASATGEVLYTTSSAAINPTTGVLSVGGSISVGPTVANSVVPAFTSNNAILSSFTSNSISGTGTQNLDVFSSTSYRTAKYLVQVLDGSNVHVSEMNVFHDGTNAYLTEYGINTNNGVLGTFDATLSGGNVTLTFTPTGATAMVIKVVRIGITA